MSGGQQQRLSIARALVNDPVLILAVEATGNLDTRTSFEILTLFQELYARGRTIVFVTHNPELSAYSSRTIVLKDGRVIQDTRNEKIASAKETLAALPKNEDQLKRYSLNLANFFRIALRTLGNYKMRGFLTMLGIIIGVASVITMLAIGQGSKRSIRAQIAEMGSNMIMIHPGADMRGGVRQDPAAMQSLKLDDYQAIVDETRYVSACSPSVSSSGQAIYGSNNYPTSIYGINPDYLEIRKYTLAEGDMFTEEDILGSAKVCVVGKTIVDNLFTNGENPVGQIIRFGKIPFRIIGVLTSKGYNTMGMDQDDLILAPYTTVQKRILAITH